VDGRPVQPDRGPPKSISQEWTFNSDVSDAAVLRDKLRQMCGKVAQSLQKRGLIAHTVTVKFRWTDFTTFTRQRSVTVGIDSEDAIYRLAEAIWSENWPENRPMRLLGVGVSKLVAEGHGRQLGFDF
jgi:DNA polymerase-4